MANPAYYSGRMRSFGHIRGYPPSFICIPCKVTGLFKSFCEMILKKASERTHLVAVGELHVSLGKTFHLFYQLVGRFIQAVDSRLQFTESFCIDVKGFSVYVNRERTRTFLSLDVSSGVGELTSTLNEIRETKREFNVPTFSNAPSFHISVGSCYGDKKKTLEQILPELNLFFNQFLRSNPEIFKFKVTCVLMTTGKQKFVFNFK